MILHEKSRGEKMKKFILIGFLFLIFSTGVVSAADLSNSGGGDWKYYREITIKENSGKTLADYQVLIELNSANFDFSKAKSDGSDVRFVDSAGNELNYWIEEWSYGKAKVWVKVPLIPANGQAKIKMYYGNPSAMAVGDAKAVFNIFDDFDVSSLTPQWILGGTGSLDVSYSSVYPTSYGDGSEWHGPRLRAQLSENLNNYELVVYFYFAHRGSDLGQLEIELRDRKEDIVESLSVADQHVAYDTESYQWVNDKNGELWSCWARGKSCFSDGWHTWKETRVGSYLKVWFDGLLKYDGPTVTTPVSSLEIGFEQYQTYNPLILKIDKVMLRKYAYPEPTPTISPEYLVITTPIKLTKTVSPWSIKQGQETTVSVTVENVGKTTIKDIEVKDSLSDDFEFVTGKTSAKYDEIKPGESRTFQYKIKSKEAGKFQLPKATALYADAQGNYHEIESDIPMVKVVASLVEETPVSEVTIPPATPPATPAMTESPAKEEETPGFEALFAMVGILIALYAIRRFGR